MDNKSNDKTEWSVGRVIIIAFSVAVALFAAWFFVVAFWGEEISQLSFPGTLGDSFGVLNALFSGLALAAIAISLWQAQKQIAIQQKELKQNTAELAGQRKQMENQNKFLAKQAVQNQFFQMLDSWQELVAHIRVFKGQREYQGQYILSSMSYDLTKRLAESMKSTQDPHNREIRSGHICRCFADTERHYVSLGYYFRLFYHIIRAIDRSGLLAEFERHDFARILRSHLSDPEFVLLFYNCIRPDGEKLHPLVEKYDLLQNMNERDCSKLPPFDLEFYPETKKRWIKTGISETTK